MRIPTNCLICGKLIESNIATVLAYGKFEKPYVAHKQCLDGLIALLTKHSTRLGTIISQETSCTSLLVEIYDEGWFRSGRSLSDVMKRIGQKGYNFSKPALSNALRKLVRKGILSRQGKARSYIYIQKRPPEE